MPAPVEFRDIPSLIEAWKLHKTPYFAIFQGKELKFVNEDENTTEAEDLLSRNLEAIENSGTTAIYTLKLYEAPPINSKKEIKGSMTFRFSDYEILPGGGRNNGRAGQDPNNVYILNGQRSAAAPAVAGANLQNDVLTRILDNQEKLLALLLADREQQEEEEEEEEETETEDERLERYMQIGSAAVDKISPLLMMFVDRAFPKKDGHTYNDNFVNGTQSQAMTPVQEQELQTAVQNITTQIGEDLFLQAMKKLSLMATNDPAKLKGLIAMI